MKTIYNTGDEVLMPVTIKSAFLIGEEIAYTIQQEDDFKEGNMVLPEGMIEGRAKIGRERYWSAQWGKRSNNAIISQNELKEKIYDIPTCELVEELQRREAVSSIQVEPYQDISYKVNGPATILIITD